MQRRMLVFLAALAEMCAGAGVATAGAPVGTAITYQAQLKHNGGGVNDTCDCQFTLWDDPIAGAQVGPTLTFDGQPGNPGPIGIVDGLMTVELDFGAGAFTGDGRWLEVAVACPSGGLLQPLSPRQPIAATPYAVHALSAPGWSLTGNSGTDPATQFLGTTDDQPLVLKANNQRAFRIEPTTPAAYFSEVAPNLIGGWSGNSASAGVFGAAIGGGGGAASPTVTWPNRVTDHYGTIGGGLGNEAGNQDVLNGWFATVGGGILNLASGSASSVSGGETNSALGDWSTVGGGYSSQAGGSSSTIGGGLFNDAQGHRSTVGGGHTNSADGDEATVSGGANNTASGARSTVGGGSLNVVSHTGATVGGGQSNTATEVYATVPGGADNSAAGPFSFAAGRRAKAEHAGAFVWGDSTVADFASTAADQFLIRAGGGVGVGTNGPSAAMHVESADISLSPAATHNDDLIVESIDAVLGVYSNQGGSFGSTLVLGEVDAGGALVDKWAIQRRTPAALSALQFSHGTNPNYGANSVAMTLLPSGEVGIGVSSPQVPLHVFGGSWDVANTEGTFKIGTSSHRLKMGVATTGGGAGDARIYAAGGTNRVILGGGTTSVLAVDGDDGGQVGIGTLTPAAGFKLDVIGDIRCTALTETSSRNLKDNITPLRDALARVARLQGVMFQWKEATSERDHIGLIAEEVAEVLPELVSYDAGGQATGLSYSHLAAVLVEAVKDLRREKDEQIDAQACLIERQETQIAEQHERIAELSRRLDRLETLLGARPAREDTD